MILLTYTDLKRCHSTKKMAKIQDEELDKILNKAFDDIRRRVVTLMAKREKKLLRELKANSKQPRQDRARAEKEDKPEKHKKNYQRSRSESSESE